MAYEIINGNTLKHDGKVYSDGSSLSDKAINKEQADALIEAGVLAVKKGAPAKAKKEG